MNRWRTSEEVIPDTRLTHVTRHNPVSEYRNQEWILRNIEEDAVYPKSDQYEVKFESYAIDTEYER